MLLMMMTMMMRLVIGVIGAAVGGEVDMEERQLEKEEVAIMVAVGMVEVVETDEGWLEVVQ